MEAKSIETKTKKKVGKLLVLMFKWIGRHWPLMIISLILLAIITYLRSIIPLFGQYIIDVILKYSDEGSTLPMFLQELISADTQAKQLLLAAIVLVGVELFRSILIFLRRTSAGFFAESVAYDLRNNLYRKLQNLDHSFHAHAETGDIIQRVTTDVEAYKRFISDQIVEVLRLLLVVGFAIWQMAKFNVSLMLISLIISPVLFVVAIFYFRKVKKLFEAVESNEAKMTTHVQENVSGARVVKAFANEKFEIDKFEDLNRKFTDSDFRLAKRAALFWSVTDVICFAQFCVIAVAGIVFTVKGNISIGVYTAFLAYSGNIIWPMRRLGRLVSEFSKATVAVSRLDDILHREDEYQLSNGTLTPDIKGDVRFEGVSFKFSDSNYHQLENINFSVKRGETVAIIGKTGSGKSTLMKLLVRLLDYQDGSIFIDDVLLSEIEKHHLRQNVGFILQEPFLFSKTVAENIGIVDHKQNDISRVQEVAKIAHVHQDIVHFEKGYETLVGERGITLSGGQKQRVAIARMLLKPKPILIFDDSLSAVDTETDIQIRNALKREWKDSTVFIITHRITTAKEANRIFVLDHGRIVESGSHKELIKRKGLYRSIWEIQSRIDYQVEGGEDDERI
ncbi:MAG: ABC transporter ATP-binding protein [Candidatus Izemoplasmatales bacterium]|jgi:ATP-binding cassette subfamily B protein